MLSHHLLQELLAGMHECAEYQIALCIDHGGGRYFQKGVGGGLPARVRGGRSALTSGMKPLRSPKKAKTLIVVV